MQLNFRPKEGAEKITIEWNLPTTLKEKVAKYGEEVVNARAEAALTVDAQGICRRHALAGKKPKEIETYINNEWKPDVRAAGKSPMEKATALLSKLSAAEKAELLKTFRTGK